MFFLLVLYRIWIGAASDGYYPLPSLPLVGSAPALGIGHASYLCWARQFLATKMVRTRTQIYSQIPRHSHPRPVTHAPSLTLTPTPTPPTPCRKRRVAKRVDQTQLAVPMWVLDRRMVFLHAPRDVALFFGRAEVAAFQPAVEPWTKRIFGLDSDLFFRHHHAILGTLRNSFVADKLTRRMLDMAEKSERRMDDIFLQPTNQPSTPLDLVAATRRLLLTSGLSSIFSDHFLVHLSQHHPTFFDDFTIFEAGFELAASPLPLWLQPTWCAARRRLVAALSSGRKGGALEGSLAEHILRERYVALHVLSDIKRENKDR